MFVGRVCHEVFNHLHNAILGFHANKLALRDVLLTNDALYLNFRVNHLVRLFVGLYFSLSAHKILIDQIYALVNEFGCVDGLVILVFQSALVIQGHKRVENVTTTLHVGVKDIKVDGIGFF